MKEFIQQLIIVLFCSIVCFSCNDTGERTNIISAYDTWNSYLGGPDRNHYTTLSQINPNNVKNLKIVWSYKAIDSGQMQMNPIIIDTLVYGVTAALRAVALHAESGKEIWRFGDSLKLSHSTSRGLAYWSKGNDKRIFHSVGADLYALNALTGIPISSFGNNGKIDLRSGMPEIAKNKFVISNTPGTVYKDLIIMPLRLSEDAGAAPARVSTALEYLTGLLPADKHFSPNSLISLSGKHLGSLTNYEDTPLRDDDELAIIAPVAGG
jgi:quinoprotein glucose dehydrogenase